MNKKTPKAVRQAAERAEELSRSIKPQEGQEGQQSEEGQQPEEGQQAGEGQQLEEGQQAEEGQQVEEGQQAEVTPNIHEPGQDPEPHKQGEDYEHRYRSLRGKYDAEVPRMAATIRHLERQVTQLQQQLEETQNAPQQASAPQQQENTQKPLVTDEEKEEYGEDFAAFVERIARRAAEYGSSDLTPVVNQLKGEVAETRRATATERMYQTLDTRVPNWRSINKMPEFLAWLEEYDPLSGATRRQLLGQAFENTDGMRVAGIFNTFAEASGLQGQPREERVPDQGKPKAQNPQSRSAKLPMESLAGPRQSSGTVQPEPEPETEDWTRKDIATFYKDVTNGAYKNKPDLKRQKETSIALALAEGRVKP